MNPYRILDKISSAEALFIATNDHWFRGYKEAYERCLLELSEEQVIEIQSAMCLEVFEEIKVAFPKGIILYKENINE